MEQVRRPIWLSGSALMISCAATGVKPFNLNEPSVGGQLTKSSKSWNAISKMCSNVVRSSSIPSCRKDEAICLVAVFSIPRILDA